MEPHTELRRDRRAPFAIASAALAVRTAVVVATTDWTLGTGDAQDYHRLGVSLATGHGWVGSFVPGNPTAFRPPLFPLLLAGIYRVVGVNVTAARLTLAALGTVTVVLCGVLAQLIWGRRVGLIAAAIAAFYPPMIVANMSLLTEALFVPLLLASVICAIEYRRVRSGTRWLVGAGVLLGLALLTRETANATLLPIAILTANARPWRRAIKAPAILLGITLLTVLPWTIRNAVVMHHAIPVSTSLGFALAGTYNETSYNLPHFPWIPPYLDGRLRNEAAGIGDEYHASLHLFHLSLSFVREHPSAPFTAAYWNSRRFFELEGRHNTRFTESFEGVTRGYADSAYFGFLFLFPVALVGACTRRAREVSFAFWMIPIVIALAMVFIFGTTRYRVPCEPFFVFAAALAICAMLDRSPRVSTLVAA